MRFDFRECDGLAHCTINLFKGATWSAVWPLYWSLSLVGFTRLFTEGIWFIVWLLSALGSLGGITSHAPDASVFVTTQRYDNERTGANTNEKILSTANVSSDRFGKLFTRAVDDDIYAQPLYVHDVLLPNRLVESLRISDRFAGILEEAVRAYHLGRGVNMLFIATVNNSVYAFDADDPAAAAPLWKVNLTGAGARPVRNSDVGQRCRPYDDFRGNIGIVGAPVIDVKSHTLYVVARTKETGKFVQRLHALNIATGAERPNSPIIIEARVRGLGAGSSNGVLAFDAQIHNQRGALLLANGILYVTWGAHCDSGPYHGWIMGYDATSLEQVFAKSLTPDGEAAGIWQSGTGPSVDAFGDIYLAAGNGTVSAPDGGEDFGNGIIKLSRTGEILDWFVPSNYEQLNLTDGDLGTTGVLLIPGTTLLATGSKEGKLYVLHRNELGHFQVGSDRQISQTLRTGPGFLHGTPTYWNGEGGPYVYVWSSASPGLALRLNTHAVVEGRNMEIRTTENLVADTSPESDDRTSRARVLTESSKTNAVGQHIPGGMLSISADGTKSGSGILWASLGLGSTFMGEVVPGILRAFDARDLSRELWNSQQNRRDDFGNFAKFNTPIVANGKVYLATFSHQVAVFGLLPKGNIAPSVSARSSPAQHNTAELSAEVTDDSLPNSQGPLTTSWVQVSGPGRASIEKPHDLKTKVTLHSPGRYLFRFAASDGELSSDANVAVDLPVSEAGLVGYWTFKEGSGHTVKDASVNRNDGSSVTKSATDPIWGAGAFAGSVSLNHDDHIRISASASLNRLRRQITVVAHVYPRTLPATDYVAVVQRQWRQTIHPDLFYLGFGPTNVGLHYKWHLGLVGSQVDLYGLPGGQAEPKSGAWTQLVGTYNADTGRAALYVDGELIGTTIGVGEIRTRPGKLRPPARDRS